MQQTTAHARPAINTLKQWPCCPFMGSETLRLLCSCAFVDRIVTMQWQGTNGIMEDIYHSEQP